MVTFLLLVLAGAPTNSCTVELKRLVTPAVQREDCRLDIGDAVDVQVKGDRHSWGVMVIEADGTLTPPLMGKVPAANLTLSELSASLETQLRKVMRSPSVKVRLANLGREPSYFLSGDVQHYGEYYLLAPITARQAIEEAGGFKGSPRRRKIEVFRNGRIIIKFDSTRQPAQDMDVQAGDCIIVFP